MMKTDLTDGIISLRPYSLEDADELYEAVREGIMRKAFLLHGTAHDAVLTSLVEEDMKSWHGAAGAGLRGAT
jgi:hypothetical protein